MNDTVKMIRQEYIIVIRNYNDEIIIHMDVGCKGKTLTICKESNFNTLILCVYTCCIDFEINNVYIVDNTESTENYFHCFILVPI